MRQYFQIRGHVQGIGYRYFVIRSAEKKGLTGWVRNCSNGDVECEAQGDASALDGFVLQLESGHPWARVENIHVQTIEEKKKEKGFEIRY